MRFQLFVFYLHLQLLWLNGVAGFGEPRPVKGYETLLAYYVYKIEASVYGLDKTSVGGTIVDKTNGNKVVNSFCQPSEHGRQGLCTFDDFVYHVSELNQQDRYEFDESGAENGRGSDSPDVDKVGPALYDPDAKDKAKRSTGFTKMQAHFLHQDLADIHFDAVGEKKKLKQAGAPKDQIKQVADVRGGDLIRIMTDSIQKLRNNGIPPAHEADMQKIRRCMNLAYSSRIMEHTPFIIDEMRNEKGHTIHTRETTTLDGNKYEEIDFDKTLAEFDGDEGKEKKFFQDICDLNHPTEDSPVTKESKSPQHNAVLQEYTASMRRISGDPCL